MIFAVLMPNATCLSLCRTDVLAGDVITRPSHGMLAAIIETTLGDDVFREDKTTLDFEAHVAAICGREAGMFVVTGTMANQLCYHALVTSRPCGIVVAQDAHSINFEGGGPSVLSGGMIQPISPSNGKYLRVEDLEKYAVVEDGDVHKCPTGLVSMENTAHGVIIPLNELSRIRDWTREHGIKTHLDGARLFEAVAAGAGSLRDYCTLVDLVSVDFSKNLGAPMGAMVLGDQTLIQRMRRTKKAIGGGLRQSGVITAAARHALYENFGPGKEISSPILGVSQRLARVVAAQWLRRGGRLTKPVETNLVWLDIEVLGVERATLNMLASTYGVLLDGPRIVIHHQIEQRGIDNLYKLFDDLLEPARRADTITAPATSPCILKQSPLHFIADSKHGQPNGFTNGLSENGRPENDMAVIQQV